MADVRTFRAPTMQAALELVRRELGSDAVILHTRQISQKRFLRKPIEEVEITASLEVNVRPIVTKKLVRPPLAKPAEAAATPARATSGAIRSGSTDDEPGVEFAFSDAAVATRARDALSTSTNPSVLKNARRGSEAPSAAPVNRFARQESDDAASVTEIRRAVDPIEARLRQSVGPINSGESAALSERLNAIERMLEQLGRSVRNPRSHDIPAELMQLFSQLLDQDVEDAIARDIIFALQKNAPVGSLANAEFAQQKLLEILEQELATGEWIVPSRGRRDVVALVGATGVGKTTTLAKLAANYKLREGIKVGLVTVDTYRIAAVEQLRTYAEIIDLPMRVVTNPVEMAKAMDELTGLDLVLIDTAGRSPRDKQQILELGDLLDAAEVDQVHLVLSLNSGSKSLEHTIQKFAPIEPDAVIGTKLDEAAGLGPLLSVSRTARVPFSYLTTGQDVPDDIEPARSGRLARLLLKREPVRRPTK